MFFTYKCTQGNHLGFQEAEKIEPVTNEQEKIQNRSGLQLEGEKNQIEKQVRLQV